MSTTSILALVLLSTASASALAIQEADPTRSRQAAATYVAARENTDDAAIQWFLPADFDAAVARARADQRLILIKGVSFGIDKEGASCATAGTW